MEIHAEVLSSAPQHSRDTSSSCDCHVPFEHANRRILSKMSVRVPKTINESYTLADKCARAEEGRSLPGEEDGVDVDSEDGDETANPKRRSRKHNKKRREKSVLAVEDSVDLGTGKCYLLSTALVFP